MRKNELVCSRSPVFDVYALSVCALLTALSVVLARLLTVIPSEVSRFSLEAVPIILSGLLFGAVPGALVGFAADLIGCLFSPFGYNPIFCLPPILYGLWAGLLRRYVWRRPTVWRVALAVFPAAALGSVFLSAVTVLVFQGGIALLAGLAAPVLSTQVVTEMSAVGGALFIGMAINLLGLREEKIKVGDMLPAIFLPILYFPIAELVSGLL